MPAATPTHTRPPAQAIWAAMTVALAVAAQLCPVSAEAKKTPPSAPAAIETYAQNPAAMRFADDVAQRRDLDVEQVRAVLAQARKLPSVQKAMLPASKATAKNWAAYRARFIEPTRLRAGQAFWQQHRYWLEKAEADTGVPASLIVGILGVETIYGQHMGNYRVIDALATLAFDFPASHPRAAARTAYFLGELEQYLSLTHRHQIDPSSLRGSYAGAMGLPQFMPTSWVKYAVDFDGDGKTDIFGSPADAIGSVANYFKGFGWKPGMPTHYPVRFDAARLDLDTLLAPDILPTFTATRFEANGAVLTDAGRAHTGPLALIELHNGDPAHGGQPPSYVAGTDNFYAVTRYNWSSYYALAVIELGQTIAARMKTDEQGSPTTGR